MGCLCITGYLPGSQRFVKSLRQFAGTSSRCHSWVESGNIPIELEYGPVELDFMGLFSNKGESNIVTSSHRLQKESCRIVYYLILYNKLSYARILIGSRL